MESKVIKHSKNISVFAPATVANVACGFDILGFCLQNPADEMTLTLTEKSGAEITSINGVGCEALPLCAEQNVASIAVNHFLKHIGSQQGISISIYKNIKPGSGIGSSAASSAGAVWAANQLLGMPLTTKELIPFAMEGEKHASNTAHADNVAPALLGGFTLIRSYQPLDVIRIDAPENLYATIIHPQIEVKTADARQILKKNISLKNAVRQWGNVGGLIAGLMKSDYSLIGRSLEDVVVEPIRSMLIPKYHQVKKAATQHSALGAGISGSGPAIFALSEGKENALNIEKTIRQIYTNTDISFETYISPINTQGCVVK